MHSNGKLDPVIELGIRCCRGACAKHYLMKQAANTAASAIPELMDAGVWPIDAATVPK
jgi:hypothetical protein